MPRAWQECHYAPTQGGAHSSYINDPELCSLSNFLVLLNSATPYNCLTTKSRLEGLESEFCDPLELADDTVPTSNVIRWRPNGRGRYRHIDLYMDTIAFQVDKKRRLLKLAVKPQAQDADFQRYEVPLFEDSDRFGSMKPVAQHVTERLKASGVPLLLKYDIEEGRFVFQPSVKSFTFMLRLDSAGDDNVLPILGFAEQQCGVAVRLPEKTSPLVRACAALVRPLGTSRNVGGGPDSLFDTRPPLASLCALTR